MIDIWKKYKRHIEEKHLIQSWDCSRCYRCPLTLTVPVPADSFLLKPPMILCLWTFFDHLSLSMFTPCSGQAGSATSIMAHPLPKTVLKQWGESIGAYRPQLPHASGGVSEAFSVHFLRGSQHGWASAAHSANVLIHAPCVSFFTFHVSFSHLCPCASWSHLPNDILELKSLF